MRSEEPSAPRMNERQARRAKRPERESPRRFGSGSLKIPRLDWSSRTDRVRAETADLTRYKLRAHFNNVHTMKRFLPETGSLALKAHWLVSDQGGPPRLNLRFRLVRARVDQTPLPDHRCHVTPHTHTHTPFTRLVQLNLMFSLSMRRLRVKPEAVFNIIISDAVCSLQCPATAPSEDWTSWNSEIKRAESAAGETTLQRSVPQFCALMLRIQD